MTVFCSRCEGLINDSEFHIQGMLKVPYTIKDGNLLCHDCYDELKKENK